MNATLKAQIVWQPPKMKLQGQVRQHVFSLDAKPPFGDDQAPSPKELVLTALCGCTAMDVVALLKKFQVVLKDLRVEAQAQLTKAHPVVFESIDLTYYVQAQATQESVITAVQKSLNQYCSVTALLNATAPIHVKVYLDDQLVAQWVKNKGESLAAIEKSLGAVTT